jgi:hypothetical protein
MSEEILHLSLNSDHSRLALGSTVGFKVFEVHPMSLLYASGKD